MDIEKDVSFLNEKVQQWNKNYNHYFANDITDEIDKENKAIEHILSEREQDKKRINELEEENHIQRSQIMTVYDNGWIPKQKVKDLKESIILGPTIVGGRRNSKTLEYGIKLGKIKACEELLEEK